MSWFNKDKKIECEKDVITIHTITKKFQQVDGIGRLHLCCKDCGKSICMHYKDINKYEEGQEIKEYLGGQLVY